MKSLLRSHGLRRFSRFLRITYEDPGHVVKVGKVTLHDKYAALKDDVGLQAAMLKEEAVHLDRLKARFRPGYLDELVEKSLGRQDSRTEALPEKIGDYYYYTSTRYVEDKDYLSIYRYKKDRRVDSELVFDPVKEKAIGKGNMRSFLLHRLVLSDCQTLLGVIIDAGNNERPKGLVKNLAANAIFPERLYNTTNFVFSRDNRFVYYVRQDDSNRPCAVYRHKLGDRSTAADLLIYEEPDKRFFVDLQLSKSKDYYIILSTLKTSCKVRVLERPAGEQSAVSPVDKLTELCDLDEQVVAFQKASHGCFVVQFKEGTTRVLYISNANFAKGLERIRDRGLMGKSSSGRLFEDSFAFEEVTRIPSQVTVTECDVFDSCLLMYLTSGGRNQILKIMIEQPTEGNGTIRFVPKYLRFEQENQYGTISPASNMDLQPESCTFYHDSVFVFNEAYEVNLKNDIVTRKEPFLATGAAFNPDQYAVTLVDVPARDGTKIPTWCVHRRELDPFKPKYHSKCLLRFYGCYGVPTDLGFSLADWNMLEENWILMMPLIRGGGDFGPNWHKSAVSLTKRTSIADVEDAATWAIASGLTHSALLCGKSNSAGAGLLAACINRKPHLFKAVILDAPFLDMIGLLSDKDLPLAQSDYDEFGNPEAPEQLKSLLGICPYTNIRSKEYPAVMLNCFEDDYRTPTWQVLKWVRKMRSLAFAPRRAREISGKNIFLNHSEGSHQGGGSNAANVATHCLELAFLETILARQSNDYSFEYKLKGLS